ncbi:MAG: diphthine--ammonia ligase [Nanoarchaeota archaeon]|nr:diphthine--ammonia ligase [Nanoarchaeota archaeon]
MRAAALVSGGKDSLFAAYKAGTENKLVCIIAIKSLNPDSFMFHHVNIELVKLQAKAMELPLIFIETKGKKEEELKDLENAIQIAKEKYKIQGIVSGAIASNYQKTRIENICLMNNLDSITPLWHINAERYMNELIVDFNVIIAAIAAEGLSKDMLGQRIDLALIEKLKKSSIHIAGEGGEYESLVLNCPLFRKSIKIIEAETKIENDITGKYIVKKAILT